MANKKSIFSDYLNVIYKAKLESMGGVEVSYRKLTSSESDYFQAIAMSAVDFDVEDKPTPKLDKESLQLASNIKYEKLSLVLVEPKQTEDELKGLPSEIIHDLVETLLAEPTPELDDEGNSQN